MWKLFWFVLKPICGTLIGQSFLAACHWAGLHPELWLVTMFGLDVDFWKWVLSILIGFTLFFSDRWWPRFFMAEKNSKKPSHVTGISEGTSIRRLLASVWDDALSYEIHSDEMNNRLRELDTRKGYFIDSPHAEAFRYFMRDARALIGSKEVTRRGNPGIPFHEVQMLRDSINKHHETLKQALAS